MRTVNDASIPRYRHNYCVIVTISNSLYRSISDSIVVWGGLGGICMQVKVKSDEDFIGLVARTMKKFMGVSL